MQPTIRESIQNALEALSHNGYRPGGAIYDDLAQALIQIDEDVLEERLAA